MLRPTFAALVLAALLSVCSPWQSCGEMISLQSHGCSITLPDDGGWTTLDKSQYPTKCILLANDADDQRRLALYAFSSPGRPSLRGSGKETFLSGYKKSMTDQRLDIQEVQETMVGEWEALRVRATCADPTNPITVVNLLVAQPGLTLSLVITNKNQPAWDDPVISTITSSLAITGKPETTLRPDHSGIHTWVSWMGVGLLIWALWTFAKPRGK